MSVTQKTKITEVERSKMPNNHPTLFERIGGKQMIAEVVDDFYDRVFADPELKPFFKNTSIDKQTEHATRVLWCGS